MLKLDLQYFYFSEDITHNNSPGEFHPTHQKYSLSNFRSTLDFRIQQDFIFQIYLKKRVAKKILFLGTWSNYSRVHNSIGRFFGAGNQDNHQNFEINDTSYERAAWFHWDEAKKFQNGRLKKTSFSSSANAQYFYMKIS